MTRIERFKGRVDNTVAYKDEVKLLKQKIRELKQEIKILNTEVDFYRFRQFQKDNNENNSISE
jgi:phenylacetate-coenzyme A ligase PaaK-like adenylate-forming protein